MAWKIKIKSRPCGFLCRLPVFPPTRYTTLLVSISFARAYKSTHLCTWIYVFCFRFSVFSFLFLFSGTVDLVLIIYVNPTKAVTFICLAEYLSPSDIWIKFQFSCMGIGGSVAGSLTKWYYIGQQVDSIISKRIRLAASSSLLEQITRAFSLHILRFRLPDTFRMPRLSPSWLSG